MRTDVKVGVICVFALVLAVVGYFVFHDSKTSKDIAANNTTVHPSGTPVGGASGQMSITPPSDVPTTAPNVASNDTLVAPTTPSLASGSPFGPTPAYGQTPSNNGSSYGGPIIGQPSATTTPSLSNAGSSTPPASPLGPGTSSLGTSDSLHAPLSGGATSSYTTTSPGLLPPPSTPSNNFSSSSGTSTVSPLDSGTSSLPHRSSLDIGSSSGSSSSSNTGSGIDLLGGTSSSSTPGTYTIAKGDTFGAIAKKNGLTTKAIIAANPGVSPTHLKIGQKIKLPTASSTSSSIGSTGTTSDLTDSTLSTPGATTKPAKSKSKHTPSTVHSTGAANAAAAGGSYTIKKGDTLRKIAKAVYGDESAWSRIFRANRGDLSSPDDLKVGQVIHLPK